MGFGEINDSNVMRELISRSVRMICESELNVKLLENPNLYYKMAENCKKSVSPMQ